MTDKTELLSFPNGHDIECPMCSSQSVDTRLESDTFEYGSKKNDLVKLTVSVPVRKCNECGFEFIDADAEDIRHTAVCKHLGRMAPIEIRALRNSYGLTRKQFSDITLLGEASLARWENGELIQNAAYDQLLLLLMNKENMESLIRKFNNKDITIEPINNDPGRMRKFRALDDFGELAEQAKKFKLATN